LRSLCRIASFCLCLSSYLSSLPPSDENLHNPLRRLCYFHHRSQRLCSCWRPIGLASRLAFGIILVRSLLCPLRCMLCLLGLASSVRMLPSTRRLASHRCCRNRSPKIRQTAQPVAKSAKRRGLSRIRWNCLLFCQLACKIRQTVSPAGTDLAQGSSCRKSAKWRSLLQALKRLFAKIRQTVSPAGVALFRDHPVENPPNGFACWER
jgi:hypothetical protein